MVGPILYQEMLVSTRRQRAYWFRWCYAGWIILQLFGMLWLRVMMSGRNRSGFDGAAFSEFARNYLETLLTQHYLVMLLATPVLTAGAITDEKWRGTLQYLLVTELASWEILLGKLLARLYQVLLLALTPLPLICLLGPFGGLDLPMLLALGISSLAMAFAFGSMSLLASVLCRHTRDAVLGMYTIGVLLYFGSAALHNLLADLAGTGSSVWLTWSELLLSCLDPLHPMGSGESLDDPVLRNRQVVASVTAWGMVGLMSLVPAVLCLRGSYLKYLEHTGKLRWWPVVAVCGCGWSVFGLAALVVYLLARGQAAPYLDGTSQQPWGVALLLFLLAWIALGLVPMLAVILVLRITGRSHSFLTRLHRKLSGNWLTRRARMSGDPLRWRERHVEGVAPLAFLRSMPRWLGVMAIVLVTSASSLFILAQGLDRSDTPGSVLQAVLAGDLKRLLAIQERMTSTAGGFYLQGMVVMLLAGLVIAIRCSGAITGEREKSTWEALLLTPLTTRQLIRGKLWGIIGASIPYLLAFALPAMVLAAIGGLWSLVLTVVWLGVTLLAMTFVGAAGLWCSVRSKSSWRSLLGTLGITYLGGFVLYCTTGIVMILVALVVFLGLLVIQRNYGIPFNASFAEFFSIFNFLMCIGLAGFFALMAWRLVVGAEYRVSVLERTKHWRDEPKHPRWSRHARERKRQLERDR